MNPRRAASCAKTWQPSNYVCLSCRHQFITRQRLPFRQASEYSTPSNIASHGLASNTLEQSPEVLVTTIEKPSPVVAPESATLKSSPASHQIAKKPIKRQLRSNAGESKDEAKDKKSSQVDGLHSKKKRIDTSQNGQPVNSAPGSVSIAEAMLLSERHEPQAKSSRKGSRRKTANIASRRLAARKEGKHAVIPSSTLIFHQGAQLLIRRWRKTTALEKRRKTVSQLPKAAAEARTNQPEEESTKSKRTKKGKTSRAAAKAKADEQDHDEHRSLWAVMSRLEATAGRSIRASKKSSDEATAEAVAITDDLPNDFTGARVTLNPSALTVTPLDIPQPAVPQLEYGLDRVLFNPGVYQLQDPLSRVHNFDPYLQKIMPVAEFDFNALKEYKTSSRDSTLASLAQEYGKRYIGSTSSMTSTLAHFHFLLSAWRPVNTSMISRGFNDKIETFTRINRAPNAMFLRWRNGTYAIDADKEYDSGNVLMLLGKSMEKLLTMPTSEYERYRKSDPREVSEEERTAPEAYQYTTMGDFLMRSQLDAHDPRLPGTGMFDLKTRAVLSVRMDAEDFEPMTGYEIQSLQGKFTSYEREYYDMIRSTMLKYMLQARMGRMDGIFVAYHNVERIFGFQYLPMQELDWALHGQVDPCLGDQEFKASVKLLNEVLDKAIAKFPETSLRFHFETSTETMGSGDGVPVMWIFAEPMEEEQIEQIQATSKHKIEEFERAMMGMEKPADSTSGEVPVSDTASVDSNDASSSVPVSASHESAKHTLSQADADPAVTESPTPASPLPKAPLFAASLVCRTHVNGISYPRTTNLKRADVWEIEYILREWDEPDAMWARYDQMKARRKETFDKYSDEGAEDTVLENGEPAPVGESSSKHKRDRPFIEFLREMSARGREFRSKIDELEAGKTPVVVGQPRALSSSPSSVGTQVASVDDYMRLLYSTSKG